MMKYAQNKVVIAFRRSIKMTGIILLVIWTGYVGFFLVKGSVSLTLESFNNLLFSTLFLFMISIQLKITPMFLAACFVCQLAYLVSFENHEEASQK